MELNRLKELLTTEIQKYDYELVSISFNHTKDGKVLSITVDRIEPINMDDIVDITRKINDYIDTLDPFNESYTLDISSLGAEKPLLKDNLIPYLNRFIHVHLINPIEGENIYEGTLVKQDEESISLSFKVKTRIKNVDIQKSNISKIRLAIKF